MSLWGSFERGMGIQTNGAFLNLVQEEEVSCSQWRTVYLLAEACWGSPEAEAPSPPGWREGAQESLPCLSSSASVPPVCRKPANTQTRNTSSTGLFFTPVKSKMGTHQWAALFHAVIQRPGPLPSCGSAVFHTWLPRSSCSSASSQ